ncbi:MAG: hypothetical protein K0S33_1117 [Bacteroidetes bacterium]|jgi:hypothetical protein|nr:hypothetical protein [Bacteroidota bacterium]
MLRKLFSIPFILLLCSGCWDEKSREKFRMSNNVCNDITAETYTVFGQGAFGADLYGEWITDSVNFRVFVGTHDIQYTLIRIKCMDDTLTVVKTDEGRMVETKTYSIAELKALKNIDED